METTNQVNAMLEAFDIVGISPSEFIIELLNDHCYINHKTVINLRESGQHLTELLMVQSNVVKGLYAQEVQTLNSRDPQVGEDDVSEDDKALWEELGDLDLEEIVDGLEGNMSKKKNRIIAHQNKLTTISMHTPQRVIDTLSRMGVSMSVNAINAAVLSLSAESHHAIHALG
ncbi:hypothetical protein EDB19DRAFT_1835838 [Suillus lakei]|nr:hypothetical protein EDB19DRAFT_1835838 [Suillus lakei]